MCAKFSTPKIATVFQPKSWARMKKVSPWLKKCPKWGPKKGGRGCQRTAFEVLFSITDRGRFSQTSQGLCQTSQASMLVLFRRSFHHFVHVPKMVITACLEMPRKNWPEFRPCILLFLLIFSPQSTQQDWTCKKKWREFRFAASPRLFAALYSTGLNMQGKNSENSINALSLKFPEFMLSYIDLTNNYHQLRIDSKRPRGRWHGRSR